jgi:predicted transcriptional regulator of viral defense system/very-short-patch-repair endonuclease
MATHPAETGVVQRKLRGGEADAIIAELAARQHGLIAVAQLLAAGVSEEAVRYRREHRRLRRIHRGVYATGHAPLSADAWAMAGVLSAGAGASLAARSAGHRWGMLRSGPSRVEVIVPRERRQLRAVRFHYGRIEPDEITTLRGMPITGVSRTIFDLARTESPQRVAAAMKEAEVLRLFDDLSLPTLLDRYPRRPGVALLRSLMGATLPRTRSELELAFLEFLAARRLPLPETNVWLQIGDKWIEADCVWRKQKVIAELDGYAVHGTAHAFESDRARDRHLAGHRWQPIRITWRAVHDDAQGLEEDLRRLLAA